MALQALRPAPKLLFKILSWGGHYGALHAPKPPWFLSDERKEPKLAGETPVPLSVRHNGYARKISLRGSPRLEREIFPLARMPSRGCKAFIFLGIPTQEQGEF